MISITATELKNVWLQAYTAFVSSNRGYNNPEEITKDATKVADDCVQAYLRCWTTQ